jgi:hypothetical protein
MSRATKKSKATTSPSDAYRRLDPKEAAKAHEENLHVYGNKIKCITDTRGFATRDNDARVRIVVDASEGFIPLWAKNSTLRWRFQEQSMKAFANPLAAKAAIRNLLGEALLAWGDAVPVKFAERKDAWDFEVSVRSSDDCDINGCTLASAFFPDSGRHELVIYPKMLEQPIKEQIETLAHELGHVFGLRHFFAKLSESTWPSEIFGTHKPFSIMNYGAKSVLTTADKADLKNLYQQVWAQQITAINGTEIRLVRPFHYT